MLLIGENKPQQNELVNNNINNNQINDNSNNNTTNNSFRKNGTFKKNNTNILLNTKNNKKDINSKESPNIINQKYLNSNRNEFKTKANEINKNLNRMPWGWGGNTTKNIDSAKKINYDIEIKSFRHGGEQNNDINNTNNMSKSHKKIKENNNSVKKSRNIDLNEGKRKRGMSSYTTFSGTNKEKKKEEEKI